ncbi:MAG: DUF5063 domain-containing protein [Chitinophagaceae bacterium]|nr:DUF5063 domain-containing protein [Chitinophagaceae bacterium]MCW5925330.1 DUF5063 domain-containing protein [Chitinophagaceae bacterium]
MTTQLSKDITDFLELDTTKNFLVAANQFVTIIEAENINKDDFIKQVHLSLIDLYSTGHKLQDIELVYSSADSDFDRENLFDNRNRNLISELGGQAFYFESFDPTYEKEDSPSQGWLVDDFSDIYRDIKIELEKLKIGTDEATEDALWQLKFSFRHH